MTHITNLMVLRATLLLALLNISCAEEPAVPLDTQLWKIESAWRDAGNSIRTAPASIIVFRSSGEFVSLHCTLIERPDETVYILSRSPRVAKVGRWRRERGAIVANPDCVDTRYRIDGKSVSGPDGIYSPVTRLVAPEFESYVKAAKQATPPCPDK